MVVTGQAFPPDSLRLKSSQGLAGKAFSTSKIQLDNTGSSYLIPEEKDLNKLKLKSMKNAVAIPITDGQKPIPLGVLQVYNYD